MCRVAPGIHLVLRTCCVLVQCHGHCCLCHSFLTGFCHFGLPEAFPGAQAGSTEENIPRARLVLALPCSPTGFIAKLQQGRGSVCSFPFLVVPVAFLCFYLRMSCAGVRASAVAGIVLCLTATTRDSLQENVHLLCGFLCSPHLCRGLSGWKDKGVIFSNNNNNNSNNHHTAIGVVAKQLGG